MRIRPYAATDAPALSELYRRSVLAIGPAHYSPAQVAAWASLAPPPDRVRELCGDGRVVLVAAGDDGRPLGYIDLEPDGHIGFLYCAPEAAGTGVAAALYARLESEARDRGMSRLHTEASEAASRFFSRQGFVRLSRRDLRIGGVAIHNYDMEKRL